MRNFYGDLANWTWPDVFEIARKTKARTGRARVIINCASDDAPLFLLELILTAGGKPANLCDASSMEAMRFLRQLWPYVSAVNWQTATGALLAERAYMGRSWCITIRILQREGKLDSFEICSGPGWKNESNLLGGDYMAMPKGALYPKRTLEFMHFLVSTEVQKKLAKELWWPPIRTDILRELERDDEYGPYFHQMKKALLDAESVSVWWKPEISKIYSDLFTRITTSNDSLNSIAATFQKKINALSYPII